MPNTLSDTSTTAEPHQSDSGTTAEGADQPAIPARAQRPDPASDTPGSEGEPVFDVTMPNPTPGRRLGDGGPDMIQVLTPEGERVDTAPPEYLEIVDSLTDDELRGFYRDLVMIRRFDAEATALQRQGIPSQLLIYPDENHWILKGRNSVQWYSSVFDWMRRWTGPGNIMATPAPAPEAAPQ